mgnify:CR=1 FL=1
MTQFIAAKRFQSFKLQTENELYLRPYLAFQSFHHAGDTGMEGWGM